jgi:hypothetical protein
MKPNYKKAYRFYPAPIRELLRRLHFISDALKLRLTFWEAFLEEQQDEGTFSMEITERIGIMEIERLRETEPLAANSNGGKVFHSVFTFPFGGQRFTGFC